MSREETLRVRPDTGQCNSCDVDAGQPGVPQALRDPCLGPAPRPGPRVPAVTSPLIRPAGAPGGARPGRGGSGFTLRGRVPARGVPPSCSGPQGVPPG